MVAYLGPLAREERATEGIAVLVAPGLEDRTLRPGPIAAIRDASVLRREPRCEAEAIGFGDNRM